MSKLSCTLLVDDDPTTNYLNRRLLEKMGVTNQVLVALNGQEALQMLTTECHEASTPSCPALIFLDVNMPLMDGFEFLTAYQQLPLDRQRAIVIVMLTTSVHPRDLQRLEALPVAGFLRKPLTAEKVTQILQANFGPPPPVG
ncbi:response regulator [Hymenobacter sp.]|uniref:response regulator n=1 Tax=Hymenobacter sp. TaxID=1898978 RepID=UPI00286A172B|nr:response regulator [Hymenobacter sp.]